MSMERVINNYNAIIRIAAEEAYKSEVVSTEMEDLIVGEGKEYLNKNDWIDQKIDEWIGLAQQHTISWQ